MTAQAYYWGEDGAWYVKRGGKWMAQSSGRTSIDKAELGRLRAIEERAKESFIENCDEWQVEGYILFGQEYNEQHGI